MGRGDCVKRRRIVSVRFWDHVEEQPAGWHIDDGRALEPVRCHAVGFVVRDTKRVLEICDVLSDDGGRGRRNTILKSAIIGKVKVLGHA